ncbi:MAG TPA: hypothetical protein DCQ83_06245 [Fibrobacteres bacterium]|nr:hypothetical protein [Fibrobacterota bacterium]
MKINHLFIAFLLLIVPVFTQTTPPADSLPAFQRDSAKAALIREIEAGKSPGKAVNTAPPSADSLDARLRKRGFFLGVTLSFAFADLSERGLFSHYMDSVVTKDTLRVLQAQDPVAIYFPIGLMVGIPVFPYLDIWLRTEHFWYRESGLANNQTGSQTREFWYAVQGNLAGIGARYLVPVSLLSVSNYPGIYFSYTRFWNFGPTGIYASTGGSVRAKTEIGGAGYEIQAGYQQNFEKHWTWTGGLAYTSLNFKSNSLWTSIIPNGPVEYAEWNLRSLRLCLQGLYQF